MDYILLNCMSTCVESFSTKSQYSDPNWLVLCGIYIKVTNHGKKYQNLKNYLNKGLLKKSVLTFNSILRG